MLQGIFDFFHFSKTSNQYFLFISLLFDKTHKYLPEKNCLVQIGSLQTKLQGLKIGENFRKKKCVFSTRALTSMTVSVKLLILHRSSSTLFDGKRVPDETML